MISHSQQRDYLGVSPKRMATMVMVLWSIVVVPQLVGAQETGLSGIATDATELVLPGVTVTALHVESGNTLVGVTDATGRFRFPVLRPGVYTITSELSGFSTVIQEGPRVARRAGRDIERADGSGDPRGNGHRHCLRHHCSICANRVWAATSTGGRWKLSR